MTAHMNGLARLALRNDERKRWESENPEIAAAWNEAREEDARRAEERERVAKAEARARYLRETAPQRLLAMGAPQRAIDVWTGGKAHPTKASEALTKMRADGLTFALLTGDTGVGKTCAAVAFMGEELLQDKRADQPVLFVRATEGARMGLYDEADRRLADQMCRAEVLVIDDLGSEFVSDGSIWRTVLDEVLDTRYGARLETVLTTNLTTEAFKARYGARIADRIRHAGVIESCGSGSLRARGEG